MKKQNSRVKGILRMIAIFVGIVIVLLYIGLPIGMGVMTVLPVKAEVGSLPTGYTDIALRTTDGVQLKGWYRPPDNGTVILLVHGAGGSKESMRQYADMLASHGYGILALDLRGHGESQGKTNRLGWQGTLDIGAAMSFLQTQAQVRHIGGLGSSMGAEVLLGAASTYPALQTIVADGASRRCADEYFALEANRPLVRSFTARVMYATVQALSGEQPPLPLLDSMRDAETTRFLLVAAGNNTLEISFNQLFARTVGTRAALWIAPGVDHTGAFAQYPEMYEERVITFFQDAFSE